MSSPTPSADVVDSSFSAFTLLPKLLGYQHRAHTMVAYDAIGGIDNSSINFQVAAGSVGWIDLSRSYLDMSIVVKREDDSPIIPFLDERHAVKAGLSSQMFRDVTLSINGVEAGDACAGSLYGQKALLNKFF